MSKCRFPSCIVILPWRWFGGRPHYGVRHELRSERYESTSCITNHAKNIYGVLPVPAPQVISQPINHVRNQQRNQDRLHTLQPSPAPSPFIPKKPDANSDPPFPDLISCFSETEQPTHAHALVPKGLNLYSVGNESRPTHPENCFEPGQWSRWSSSALPLGVLQLRLRRTGTTASRQPLK